MYGHYAVENNMCLPQMLFGVAFRRRQRIATDLAIHPQTVRYRVALLRELLGADLDDPQRRFELQLVLS